MPLYAGTSRKIITTAILLLVLLPGITISGFKAAPVLADAGPDLIVQGINLSPAEPAIDDTVTITVTVKNQGAVAAGMSYVTCYADSTILGTPSVNPLGAGTMATATFTWKAEPGSHTIRAVADSSNIISETDETNNTRTYAITTLAADLIIQSFTWSPTGPSRGDAVVFSIVVKNQGSARSRITNVNLYIDGASRGTQDILAIEPGGTVTKTYSWFAIAGQHPVKAVVDEANSAREGNEINNEYTATFSTAAPDLIIDKIVWSPQNVSKNDNVSINATVKNQGNGRADACHLAYYIDGELKSTLLVSALEAGVSTNISFSWKALADKHEIKTVIDYYNNVIESDKTNNEKTVSLATLAPDLTVTALTSSPADAAVGDNVTFTATIKNQGGGRSERARAACYIDGSLIASPDIPVLNAGAETPLTLLWVATGGSHTVSITADYDNMLAETDEDNNRLSTTISIIPPDLFIPSISWSPAGFAIDDTVTFTVTIENQGGGRAENFYVAFFIDDTVLASQPVNSIASGASVNRTCTWKALNGRHTFRAVANCYKNIVEANENNNENSTTVAPNMPDLAVDTITWSPADIPAGSEVTFEIVIKNLGTLKAGQSRAAYYVDGAVAGYTDIGQLDAGTATTVQFVWGVMAGPYIIDIIADSFNKIFEIDEANNTKTIGAPPPDLTVQGITWSPADASPGDMVTFTAIINNQGNGRSQSSQVTCYVDGAPIGTTDLPGIDHTGSLTRTFDWTATAGKHKIKVTADVNNRVTETDETNNSRETDFATLTPDIVIQDIKWLMENPLASNTVNFTITVKNRGTGMAGTSKLLYTVDKKPGVTADITAIQAGDNVTIKFSLNLESGPHTFDAVIDPENNINELDETNNSQALSFNSIAPDLVIQTITLTPATAFPSDNVTVTVKVENRGKAKSPNAKLSLSVDGSPAGSADIKEIGVGATISQDFIWKAVAGQHEIKAYADIANLVLESNEGNNSRSRVITIEKPAPAVTKPVKLAATPANNKGLIGSWWWLLLLIAAGLGGTAFVAALKSFRRKN